MMDDKRNEQMDEPLAELLRLAGPRPRIADDVKARVRVAAYDEWQVGITRRKRTRTVSALAAAAAVAGALFIFRTQDVTPVAPPPVAAIVAHRTTDGSPIAAGAIIETNNASAESLDWAGASLRLDSSTRVRLDSTHSAVLLAGAIYFSDDNRGPGRQVETPFGTVRDIGTQFEVRLQGDRVRIRVREGRVEINRVVADAGTELVATNSSVESQNVSVYGADWGWVERAAPPFILEGMTVGEVMERVAREKGLTLDLPKNVATTRLRGRVAFTPDEALDAATAASGTQYRLEDHRLIVRRMP